MRAEQTEIRELESNNFVLEKQTGKINANDPFQREV